MLAIKIGMYWQRKAIRANRRFWLAMLWGNCLLASGYLFAQPSHPKSSTPSSSSWKLTAVKVTGSRRFAAPMIVAASGLQIGQTVTEEDFQRASQRLGKTGAFDNVTYNFRYSGEGAQLELQVTDAGQWVPVRFENFVWFSDQELRATLHKQVPLFEETLPLSGDLADQVSDALQVLLLQHKIPAHADYLRAGPENGPISAIVYSVTGPDIRIRSVAFSGAGGDELPQLNVLGNQLRGLEYSRTVLLVQAEKNFLPAYLAHGYLKAAFSEAQAKVVDESLSEDNQDHAHVEVTFQVEPGRQYKLAGLRWTGNKALSLDKLQSLVPLPAGQPFDAIKLNADLDAVEKLYGAQGYVAVKIHSTPEFDDAKSTVSYQLEVQEGDVYHMGEIELRGLDDRDARRVLAKWALAKGATYDSSYAQRFLDDAFKSALLDGNWNVRVNEAPDPGEKSVDVTLHFTRRPSAGF
jgi:outer membrane protein insertion porin family